MNYPTEVPESWFNHANIESLARNQQLAFHDSLAMSVDPPASMDIFSQYLNVREYQISRASSCCL